MPCAWLSAHAARRTIGHGAGLHSSRWPWDRLPLVGPAVALSSHDMQLSRCMVCRSPNVLLTREGVAKIADVGLMRAQVP